MKKADKEIFDLLKILSIEAGKKQADLANHLEIQYHSWANKARRGSLSATEMIDLLNYLNCNVTITKPDGTTIDLARYINKGSESHELD